jgi:hypothetical protein
VLGALADQKTILLGVVVAAVAAWRSVAERNRQVLLRAMPFVLGIAAATVAFWIYGFVVAPHDFVVDHPASVRALRGSFRGASPAACLSVRVELWIEFTALRPWAALAAVIARGSCGGERTSKA